MKTTFHDLELLTAPGRVFTPRARPPNGSSTPRWATASLSLRTAASSKTSVLA